MKEESSDLRIRDLCRRYTGNLLLTGFLTPAEQLVAEQAARGLPHAFWGGYPQAERRILALLPESWSPAEEEHIAALSIRAPFAKRPLTHRDYLGSLLGLGLKRECFGDIVPDEAGAVCFLQRRMLPFVTENLLRVGSCPVQCQETVLTEALPPEEETLFDATVPQLRLDCVLAAAFRLSRQKAADYIAAGEVKLNHLPCLHRDKAVEEGDVLSLRGAGRAEIRQVGGLSKKGRLFVTIARPDR